jgi:hypothetical protein
MSIEKLLDRGIQPIDILIALTTRKHPVYEHSVDLLIKNTGETHLVAFTVKIELFCSERDYPDEPTEERHWAKKMDIPSLDVCKACSIKVTSASPDQFLRIRWTLNATGATGMRENSEGEIDLRDERNNAICVVNLESLNQPASLPEVRRF